MKIKSLLAPALAGFVLVGSARGASFASAVVNYNPGTGYAPGYTNTAVILGQPSTGTATHPNSVTPFAPPSHTNQILSLGAGGSLTVSFATPIVSSVPGNPFGLDFLIFGNSFFEESPTNSSLTSGAVFSDPCQATVSVSADGTNFYTLNPALAPQLNYFYPTDGSGNFQLPVNPALTNFTNLTLAQVRALYNGSAGGVGYAISWAVDANSNSVSLFEVRYIKVAVQSGEALIAGFSAVAGSNQVYVEDFSHNPALDGWQYYGDTNLFTWNSTNQNLAVTWDSSQSNSYFYHPIGTVLSRSDDFTMSFDLNLTDYAVGVDGNLFTFELATGYLNLADATGAGFERGSYPTETNLAEFDFFPADTQGDSASINATFVDSTNNFGDNTYSYVSLPTNVVMRVDMVYTATNQTAVLNVTTNGVAVGPPAYVYLNNTTYGVFGDIFLDTFAVESYSEINSGASLLAHGTVGNILLTAPPPPVTVLQASVTNSISQIQFTSRTNWNYVLLGSSDLKTWQPVAPTNSGTGGTLTLQDTNALQAHQFYRVNAVRAE